MGVVGGCVFGVAGAGFTISSYFRATLDSIVARDIYTGLIKSALFGLVITAVGCKEGFSTGAGAEEVGRSTTSAVVTSIALVIVVDLVFTALFYFINPSFDFLEYGERKDTGAFRTSQTRLQGRGLDTKGERWEMLKMK